MDKKSISKVLTAGLLSLLVLSCGSDKSSRTSSITNPSMVSFENSPVVAKKVLVGEDSVVVMSLDSNPEAVVVKASDFVSDLRVVKLESSEEAMVGGGKIWTDGKYIMIYSEGVVKLFNTDGKYIGNVGARGNGPGEYAIAPYKIYIDEGAGRICLIQYGAKDIMTYDLEGNFVENIPLAHKINKGFAKVDFAKKTATVAALVFDVDEGQEVVWTQDFDGNILSSVDRPSLVVIPDFSSEIYGAMTPNDDSFDYSIFNILPKADTLFNYRDGVLHPEFTVDFGSEVPQHHYVSFPEFYIVTTYGNPQMVTESSYIIPANSPFLVDKKSLRGAPAQLMLDNIGTLTLDAWQYQESPKYFVVNYDPGMLLDAIEKAPASHPLATEEGLKKMNELKESISPDDNNYIIYGRWKR